LMLNTVYLQSFVEFIKKVHVLNNIKKENAAFLLRKNMKQIIHLIKQQIRGREIIVFKS